MHEKFETGEILSSLYFKKINILDELRLKEMKLKKLGVLEIKINPIKESRKLSNLSYCF